jgi:hypothetical protein
MATYKILRFHCRDDEPANVQATGLSLEEAQEWCHSPETSSGTATSPGAMEYTETHGPWFDGYTEESCLII